MSDVWLATVDCSSVTITGHTPGGGPSANLAARLFVANDGTGAGPLYPFSAAHSFAILTGVEDNFYGGGPTYEWRAYARFLQRPFAGDPFDDWVEILQPDVIPSPTMWTPITQFQADGGNGGAYLGGGVLSVQKDWANSKYTFTTPLGSVDVPFSWLSNQPPVTYPFWVPSDTPLYAAGIGYAFAYADDSVDNSGTVKWFDFYTKKNGTNVYGWHLTAADPGFFDAPFTGRWDTPPGFGSYHPTGVLIPSSAGQETSRYREQFSAAAFPAQVYEATDEQRYIAVSSLTGPSIDMEKSVEHGVMYRAYPDLSLPRQMDFQRSFDNGHTWSSPIIAATDPAWINDSPSLNSVEGRLYLTWFNGTSILQARSLDGGRNWNVPVTLPFTGTNPRRIADKNGGPSFLFFINPGGDIKVAVTYDNGASFRGPYTVVTGVGAQQIDAEFAPDSSIVVSYIFGGTWLQKRSRDLGATWV